MTDATNDPTGENPPDPSTPPASPPEADTPPPPASDPVMPPPTGAEPPPPPPPGSDAPVPPPPAGEPPRVGLGADGAVQYQPPAAQGSWFSRLPTRVKIGVPVVLVILLIGWFAGRGQTDAEDLGPGDCFEEPSGTEFSEVTDQDCDGPHQAEILAAVNLPAGTPWPGTGGFDTLIAIEEACFGAIDALTLNETNISADAELGYFYTERSGWDSSNREVLCYVYSPTGQLPGRVLAE